MKQVLFLKQEKCQPKSNKQTIFLINKRILCDMAAEREAMQQEVTASLNAALDRLHRIWQEIGIVEEQRKDRMNVVVVHMRNLLDEMVSEEERLKDKILKKINAFKDQLVQLTKELRLPEYESPAGLSVLRLEKDLSSQVTKRKAEKEERLERLEGLRKQDQHLCDVLCATPYYIPTGSVPSHQQLTELQEHIGNLSKEKERRHQIYRNTRTSIVKFMDDLEHDPNTSFERDILNEEDDSFLLSNPNLKTLKDLHDSLERRSNDNYALASDLRSEIKRLWDRLSTPGEERAEFSSRYTGYKPSVINALKDEVQRLERLKHENLQKVIDGARTELSDWWNRCLIGETERLKFTPFYENVCTEEALKAHEDEVTRWRRYYEDNRTMLENVGKWQGLFQQYLVFEEKASDPNRLFNRGGNLLKEQKARAKFKKELPRVEEEVKEQIDRWERANNREFRVDGVRFTDYIRQQWDDYERNKENEKELRNRAKVQEMEHELMYGSKPANTPNKRRLLPGGTPNGKTPNKLRKLNETPGSVSRMGRSAYQSQHHTTNTMCSPVCMPPRSTGKVKSRTPSSASRNYESPSVYSRGAASRTPLSSRGRNTTVANLKPNLSASRKLLARSRRSISQPNLPKTPIAHRNLTPLRKNRSVRRSAGRTPRGDTPIERKRHKRMCSSPESSDTPNISLRYNPITHETNKYDCSPIAMPHEPQFKAEEYHSGSPSLLYKAKSVNSLLYGSPSKPVLKSECKPSPSIVSSPLQKAKSMNSLFFGDNETPTNSPSSNQTPTRTRPDALFGVDGDSDSPLGSPRSASPLFLTVTRPQDPPPPPPKAAGALFQAEATYL